MTATMTNLCFQTLTLVVLLSSASVSYARPPPPYEEHCPAILSTAIEYDTDSSGGLNPAEFANFWSDLIDSGSAIEQPQQVREDASAPRATTTTGSDGTDSSKQIYTILLCQCHYTFHHNLQCCDDTATDDDDDTPTELAMRDDDPMEIWTEVSLEGFAEMRWGEEAEAETEVKLDMAKYSEEFCQEVIWALEKQGIELGEDFVSDLNVTIGAGNATEVVVVVIGEDENATSTTTDASETTTVAPKVDGTDVNASTTSATTTTTTATTSSTVAEATTKATEAPALEAFDVTFIGSSNGKLNAASNVFEDITIAFWKVSLDILEDMTTTSRRTMQWDFGAEAAIYFEGVVMDIVDIECPSGLEYGVEGSPCLQFTNALTPLAGGPLSSPEAVDEFIQLFNTATNVDGKLYDALIKENPQTEFTGLGSPGKGSSSAMEETAAIVNSESTEATQQTTVSLSSKGSESNPVLVSGMPVGQIVLIAFAAGLVALVSVGVAIRRRRNNRSNLVESNEVGEDIEAREVTVDVAKAEEWADDEDGGYIGQVQSPTSSLAALGVASTVATRLSTGDTEVMMMEKQPWTKNEPNV